MPLAAKLSAYAIGPIWLCCWAAFLGVPLTLALAPFTATPWPHFIALYLTMALLGGVVLDPPVRRLDDDDGRIVPALNLVHPHGVVCHGIHSVMSNHRERARVRRSTRYPVLITPVWLLVRGLLVQYRWTSAPASAAAISTSMRESRDIWLYPGGFQEAARHAYERDVVDVTSRGAIRLALLHGYAIRVAFAFGERKTAHNLQGGWGLRMWLAKRGVPAVVPWFVVFGKSPVRLVVSRTLELPLVTSPTERDVEQWHSAYVSRLCELHTAHKAPDDPPLLVIDKLHADFSRQ